MHTTNTIPRQDLCEYLDTFLTISDSEDSCFNGLQVEGKETVTRIALAVDAGLETFRKAVTLKADFLIVHHGHFWQQTNPSLVSWKKERIKLLLENDLSLYACHLPLDRHREVGHNAQILKSLGALIEAEFMMRNGKNVGWVGRLQKPTSLTTITESLNTTLQTDCKVITSDSPSIQTIAVCSGAGGYQGFYEALDKKVDVYITGDTCDIYQTARDAKMNVIFTGHYASETIGLKALSDTLKKKFSVETQFIDIPTGL